MTDWLKMKEAVEQSLDASIAKLCGENKDLTKDDVWIVAGLIEGLDRLDSLVRYRKDTDKFRELQRRLRSIADDVPRIFVLPANSPSGYVPMAVVQPLLDMAEALKEIADEIVGLDL